MSKAYDYLIVGAGLFGAVFAHEATKAGRKCLVVDKRDHIAGNIYTEQIEGINVHRYGAHIFHTNNKQVWDYVNQFAVFNRYTNSPVANYHGELYNLPFNMNTFNKMWGVVTPAEAAAKIAEQRAARFTPEPKNLEEQAIRLVGTEGKIAIVGHSQTVVDAVQRVEGFVDYIEANSNLEIVDIQYGEGDHLKSADIAKSMLIANPDIQLIYTTNEGACVGAYNGLKEVNMIGKVLLIGFDSSAALKAGVRSGEIAGAITQDPVGMGYTAVATACKLVLGEEIEGEADENGTIVIDTGCYWYDASNMDDENIAPLLYD